MKSDTFLLLLFLLMVSIIASVDCWRRCPKGQFSPRHTECRPCRICRDTKVIRTCTPSQDTVCADVLRTKVIHFPCIFKAREMLGLFVESRVSAFPDTKKKTRQKIKRDACSSLKKYKKRILDSRKIPYDGCAAGTYLGTSARPFSNSTSVPRACLHCSACPHGTRVVYPCQGLQDTVCSFPRVNNTVELFHFACAKRGPTLQVYSSRPPSVSHTRLSTIRRKLQNNLCKILYEAYRNKHGFKKRRRNDAPFSFLKHQDAGKPRIHAGPPSAAVEGQGEQTDEERRPVLSEAKQPKQRRLKSRARKDEGKQLLDNEAAFSSKASREQELRPRGKKQRCSGKQGARARARCRKRNRGDKRLHQSLPLVPVSLPAPSSQSVRGGPEFGSIPDPSPTGTTTITLAVATKRSDETAEKLTTLMEQKAKSSPDLISQEQPELELEEADSDQEEDVEEKDNVPHIASLFVATAILFVALFAIVCFIHVKRTRRKQNSSGPKRDQASDRAYTGYSKQNQFNEILAEAEPKVSDSCSSITCSPPLSHSGNHATNVVAAHRRSSPRSEDSGFVSCHASTRGSEPQPCRESKNIFRLVESPAKQEEFKRLRAVWSLFPTSWSARSLPSSVANSVPEGSGDDDGVGLHVLGCRVDSSDDPRNLPHVPGFTDVCRNQGSNTEATTDLHGGPNTIFQLRCADVLSDSCSSQQLFDCHTEPAEAEISDYAAMHLERQGSGGFSDCYRLSSSSDQSDASGFEPANLDLCASSSRRTGQVQIPLAANTGLQERSARDSVAFLSDTSSLSHYESSPPSSDSEKELSEVSQAYTGSAKPRPPSEHSTTSSAASSVCMHIKIALNDLAKGHPHDDWLQKDSTAGPENFLSTYSASVTTQTDDWDKTNLRPKPIFASSWQAFQSFSPAGGTLTLPNSDVRLEVPPSAVPSGNHADVTAATYTNLSHLRRVLRLGEEEMMVGPVAEFHAGSGFRFQEKVDLYLPHCLPPGVAEEHVKLHHIDRGQGGELVVKLLPSKKEYDLRHEGRHRTRPYPTEEQVNPDLERGAEEEEKEEEEEEGGGGGEEDIGFFQFLPSGELLVSTTCFCGYICTICSERCPEPKIQLVATAKQIVQKRRSGDLLQVSIFLYLWDRKILIADFERDYFGSRVVGRQTLHVIEDYEESLVKVEFGLYDTESDGEDDVSSTQHQSWRHALRPRTTDPVFPAEKEFPLKELLCCRANDSPRCEEWLAENLVKPNESGHDFQCFIDICNTSNNLSEGSTNGQLSKRVTMFIGDVNNNNINNTGLGNPKVVPEQPKPGNRDGESYPRSVPYQQAAAEQQATTVSNTPFGQREQGPSSTFSPSYFPGWQPLSETPRLDPISVREWRISDPIITSAHYAESPAESSRPVSCPPGDLVSSSLPGPAADGAVRAGQGTQTTAVDEEELEQQDRRGRGSIRRNVPTPDTSALRGPWPHQQTVGLPTHFVNGERHDVDDGDDNGDGGGGGGGGTEAQQDDELEIPTEATPIPTAAEGLAELQRYGEEARRKRSNAVVDRYLREQSGWRPASRGESSGRVCDPGPNNRRGSALNQLQETQVTCCSSIRVHGADGVLRLDGRRDP